MQTAKEIIAAVARGANVPPSVLRSKSMPIALFSARRLAYQMLKERGMSLCQIARFMGGRHRTSIVHALDPNVRAKNIASIEAFKGQSTRRRKRIEAQYADGTPSSGVKGVVLNPSTGRWRATLGGRYLGTYATAEEATAILDKFTEAGARAAIVPRGFADLTLRAPVPDTSGVGQQTGVQNGS